MSIALYRRYRPETFSEVIGQEHVTDPLMAALRADRVSHAYLFSGPRGCGKTTSARIFARCLNCAEGPTDTPCGTCDSCVELARDGSGSLDVVEMDAASHGGVDDARDLRERAAFAPARDRYKIFIIDEAHMVTNQGFNALLKLVEEPPAHVKFVFATTEPEKVIGTIRSRTHHYPFRLVPPQRLTAYLEELCATEGVTVAPGVLQLVVRAGGGSVRDSLSVLDQLIAGAQDATIDYERAVALLGYTHATLLDDVVDAIAARDGASLFRVVDRVIDTGHDPRRFAEDLLERLRDLVVIAVSQEHAANVLRAVPSDQLDRMRVQAEQMGIGQLSRAGDLVNDALSDMSGATSPRLQLELLCARLLLPAADDGDHGYAARLDRLERHARNAPAAAPSPTASRDTAAPAEPAAQRGPEPAPDRGPGPAVEDERRPESAIPTGPLGQDEAAADSAPEAPSGSVPGRGPQPAQPDAWQPAVRPGSASAAEPAAPPSRPAEAAAAPAAQPAPDSAPAAAPAAAPPSPSAEGQDGAAATADADMIRRRWPEVLSTLAGFKRSTWTLVSQSAHVAEVSGGVLHLAFTTSGLAQTFRSGGHGEFVQRALSETLGIRLRIEPKLSRAAEQSPAQPPAPHGSGPQVWDAGRPTGASAPSPGTPSPTAASPGMPGPTAPSPHGAAGAAAPSTGGPAYGSPDGPAGRGMPGAPAAPGVDAGPPRGQGTVPAPPTRPSAPPTDLHDDVPRMDDPDAEDSDLVGPAVIERVLGGTVISEE
ncbi:MAG TPA: DNA polymerase III subunit gamma and tau [Actinomycetaceae bacterium]|nr:DNA polymerase III subunit gamma and tau [Actinomycetaceae bacterium]